MSGTEILQTSDEFILGQGSMSVDLTIDVLSAFTRLMIFADYLSKRKKKQLMYFLLLSLFWSKKSCFI